MEALSTAFLPTVSYDFQEVRGFVFWGLFLFLFLLHLRVSEIMTA